MYQDGNKDEAELIAQLKHGSEKAFSALYAMYAKRLYAFCLEYTKSRENTEEIVQDAFLWLWKSRSTIKQETTIKNLLFLRVKHYLINAWKANLNSPVFEDYVEYANLLSGESSDKLEYDEFLMKIESLIDDLPNTQAKVLRMSRLQGFRNKEIADKLHLSEQTVKNALSIGLKYLKSKMPFIEMMVLLLAFICL